VGYYLSIPAGIGMPILNPRFESCHYGKYLGNHRSRIRLVVDEYRDIDATYYLELFTIKSDGCAVAPANSRCMPTNHLPPQSFV